MSSEACEAVQLVKRISEFNLMAIRSLAYLHAYFQIKAGCPEAYEDNYFFVDLERYSTRDSISALALSIDSSPDSISIGRLCRHAKANLSSFTKFHSDNSQFSRKERSLKLQTFISEWEDWLQSPECVDLISVRNRGLAHFDKRVHDESYQLPIARIEEYVLLSRKVEECLNEFLSRIDDSLQIDDNPLREESYINFRIMICYYMAGRNHFLHNDEFQTMLELIRRTPNPFTAKQ